MQPASITPLPLEDIVTSWTTVSNSEEQAILQARWRIFGTEDGADSFGEFLVELNKNINADNLPFRQQTAELLDQMRSDPALRQQVFAISVAATTSCQDRVSHAMVMMHNAARAAHYKQASFATDAEAVLVQRQFHRLELLHKTAQTIVEQTRNGKEELETHLHLLIRHVDALELNGLVPAMDMRFDGCSSLSSERSATIPYEIRQQENDHFAEWQAHSPSWLDYIARTDKPRFDTAQVTRDTLFDSAFQQRLEARLNELEIGNDTEPGVRSDAKRMLGRAVSKELINEINTGLTNDFLASRGSLHVLDKHWTEKDCTAPEPAN